MYIEISREHIDNYYPVKTYACEVGKNNTKTPSDAVMAINAWFDDDCRDWHHELMTREEFNKQVYAGRKFFYLNETYERIFIRIYDEAPESILKEKENEFQNKFEELVDITQDLVRGEIDLNSFKEFVKEEFGIK